MLRSIHIVFSWICMRWANGVGGWLVVRLVGDEENLVRDTNDNLRIPCQLGEHLLRRGRVYILVDAR
jgi:hypothetical protein